MVWYKSEQQGEHKEMPRNDSSLFYSSCNQSNQIKGANDAYIKMHLKSQPPKPSSISTKVFSVNWGCILVRVEQIRHMNCHVIV